MILVGLRNIVERLKAVAGSFCSRNGVTLKTLSRKLSLMSKRILIGGFRFRLINTCIFPEMVTRIFIVAIIVLSSCFVTEKGFSQQYHTTSAKALKEYKSGLAAFDYIDYLSAEHYFKQALETDDGFFEVYMMLGNDVR
jgi:hypothetical protein